jgi:hypothetical protein
MADNTPDSKLDETVKDTLSSYEAMYESGDWSKMESMLNAAPKSSSFQWSYAVKIAIVLVAIAGGYFLVNTITSSKIKKDEVITPAIVEPVKVSPKVTVPAPSVTPPKVSTTEVAKEINKESNVPAKITPVPPVLEKIKTEDKIIAKEEKKKEDRKKDKTTTTEKNNAEENVISHNLIMGNEPVFGDMLDSAKGVVGETKEKEETKKAAKAKKDLPVGWDSFMLKNVNPDSIKKHREKRDSLKNQ